MDNITTDGAAAFETLEKIIDELKSLGTESEQCTDCLLYTSDAADE